MKSKLIFFIALIYTLCACSPAYEPKSIERLDIAVRQFPHDSVLSQYAPALRVLAQIYGTTSIDSALTRYRQSPATRVFGPDICKRLPDIATSESELGIAQAKAGTLLPEMKFPTHIYGYVTPFSQSVVISDTVMMLGLNHYLGPGYEGYAMFKDYERKLKTPERIAPDAVEAIVSASVPRLTDTDPLLSHMLQQGAVIKIMELLLPGRNVSELLGYTPDEYEWAMANEGNIWHKIIESELLFSTDPAVTARLMNPSPASTIINGNAPGRIGRFTGFRIIDSYLRRNPETDINLILTREFLTSPNTLKNAGYFPKRSID